MTRKTYDNEALGVSFSLPNRLTIREQMKFRERLVEALSDDIYTRYWIAVAPLLDDWQCEDVPDPAELDLDGDGSWRVGNVIQYVANTSAAHMMELDNVPKKM